jgi:hypothetical protein
MAKKKKKAAKKKVTGAAAAGAQDAPAASCTEQELVTAGVVTSAGEIAASLQDVVHDAVQLGVQQAVQEWLEARPISSRHGMPASESVNEEENVRRGWTYARRQLERRDFSDMPFLRFVGRVIDVLLNHRRFPTCTAGDVFEVFLVEIPTQLELNHRQSPAAGSGVDVTTQPGRRTFNNRMDRLRSEELIEPTITRESGRGEGYVLTEDGQNMFDGWPPLRDIPGLELEGPVTPETSSRRQPRRRS